MPTVAHPLFLLIWGTFALTVQGAETLVADFGTLPQTAQGEWFECWGGTPREICDELCEVGAPRRDAWRIEVTDKAETGAVGASIPLRLPTPHPEAAEALTGHTVVFQMLGELGQRTFRVTCQAREQGNAPPISLGEIASAQLPDHQWQEVRFQLPREAAANPSLDLRLTAEGSGHAWLALDRLMIQSGNSAAAVAVPTEPPPPHPLLTAMWVWTTKEILSNPSEASQLLQFCEAEQISDLFLQAVYSWQDGRLQLQLVEEQRRFNAQAHERKIRVHLLDGAPQYVLAENHARMTALIDAVIAWNARSQPNECFDAVHLDNEPYVLEAWQDPQQRDRILAEYLALNQMLYQRTRGTGLEYGIDIPFWFDMQSSAGEYILTTLSTGKQVPLLESLFGCADNVGIMAYRPRALGQNGILAHTWSEIQLGAQMGVDVFAAVELGTGTDVEPGTSLGPYGAGYFTGQLQTLRRALACQPGCGGIAIHYYLPYQLMASSAR